MICAASYTTAVSKIHLVNKNPSGHLRTGHYQTTITYQEKFPFQKAQLRHSRIFITQLSVSFCLRDGLQLHHGKYFIRTKKNCMGSSLPFI